MPSPCHLPVNIRRRVTSLPGVTFRPDGRGSSYPSISASKRQDCPPIRPVYPSSKSSSTRRWLARHFQVHFTMTDVRHSAVGRHCCSNHRSDVTRRNAVLIGCGCEIWLHISEQTKKSNPESCLRSYLIDFDEVFDYIPLQQRSLQLQNLKIQLEVAFNSVL